MYKEPKTEYISIRLTSKEKILLDKLCKQYNMSHSDFIRWIIEKQANQLLTMEYVGKGE